MRKTHAYCVKFLWEKLTVTKHPKFYPSTEWHAENFQTDVGNEAIIFENFRGAFLADTLKHYGKNECKVRFNASLRRVWCEKKEPRLNHANNIKGPNLGNFRPKDKSRKQCGFESLAPKLASLLFHGGNKRGKSLGVN